MSQRICGAETKSGDPCQAFTVCEDCGHCFSHCEHREKERQEARSRGGYATAKRRSEDDDPCVGVGEAPPPPENLEDAAAWASWAMLMNATGQLGNSRARSIAKLLDTFRQCVERGDARRKLDETIEELKEAVAQSNRDSLRAVR